MVKEGHAGEGRNVSNRGTSGGSISKEGMQDKVVEIFLRRAYRVIISA